MKSVGWREWRPYIQQKIISLKSTQMDSIDINLKPEQLTCSDQRKVEQQQVNHLREKSSSSPVMGQGDTVVLRKLFLKV